MLYSGKHFLLFNIEIMGTSQLCKTSVQAQWLLSHLTIHLNVGSCEHISLYHGDRIGLLVCISKLVNRKLGQRQRMATTIFRLYITAGTTFLNPMYLSNRAFQHR